MQRGPRWGLTSFGEDSSCTRVGRPAQLVWPLFLAREQGGPGWGSQRKRRARPRAGVAAGQPWAVLSLRPAHLKGTGSSQGLCSPAAHLHGQQVRREMLLHV